MIFHWRRENQTTITRDYKMGNNIRGLMLNFERPDYVIISAKETEVFNTTADFRNYLHKVVVCTLKRPSLASVFIGMTQIKPATPKVIE